MRSLCSSTRHVDSGQTAVPHVDLTEEGYDSRPPVVDLTGESPTATSPPRLLPPPLYVLITAPTGLARLPPGALIY